MAGLFIPRNPIETAKELQWEIDLADPDHAPVLAEHAGRIIGDVDEIYGTKNLLIHTLGCFVIKRRIIPGESVIEDTLGETILEGNMVYLHYLQLQDAPRIQTFSVLMHEVEATDLAGGVATKSNITSLVAIPVLDIQEVRAA